MSASRSVQRCSRFALLACLLVCAPAWAAICRVTTTGSDINSGSSWAVPMSFLEALNEPGNCTEIWVAKGVYKPIPGGGSSSVFGIDNGVAVYGGFAGTETLREQRDPAANVTVLSGDTDNNDSVDAEGRDVDVSHIVGSNTGPVVLINGNSSATVLDGFTITGGDARLSSSGGGGMRCANACSPTLSRLVFSGNAGFHGGAWYIHVSSGTAGVVLSHVTFQGNQATRGGAIHLDGAGGTSSLSISDSVFRGNGATDEGGAIDISGSGAPSLNRVAFVDNAAGYGAAIACSGTGTGSCNVTVTNATFAGNEAGVAGGALYAASVGAATAFHIDFATLNDNQSDTAGGGAIAMGNATSLYLGNSIVWGNRAPVGSAPEIFLAAGASATTDHSVVRGSGGSGAWNAAFGNDAGANLDVDPKLAAGVQWGGTQTLSPGPGSAAIDAADDSGCPADDQRGIVRKQGAHCDIGAAETFPIDLIGHKGMEACWSGALTPSVFLGAVRAQIEGAVTCVPPSTTASYSACNAAACPGSAPGCPLTTRAGTFAGSFGDGNFTASGGVDDTSVDIYINALSKTCTYDLSSVDASFAPSYVFVDDGNFGDYSALLNRFALTLTGYSVSSADVSCQGIVNSVAPILIDNAQAALQANLAQKLRDGTLADAVCPSP